MSDKNPSITIELEGNVTEIEMRKLSGNRRKGKDLIQLADEIGVSPFEILLHAAAGNWRELGLAGPTITKFGPNGSYEVEALPIELRIHAAKEAAQYLHPKKKAIEHSGSDEGPPVQFQGSLIDLIKLARG